MVDSYGGRLVDWLIGSPHPFNQSFNHSFIHSFIHAFENEIHRLNLPSERLLEAGQPGILPKRSRPPKSGSPLRSAPAKQGRTKAD